MLNYGVFGTYVDNNNRFPKDIQKLNSDALEYYKIISKKKNFNFRKWGVFYKLYRTENFKYYMENFAILNLPLLVKPIFKVRYIILKMKNKR